jgi:phosphate transport system permease protein
MAISTDAAGVLDPQPSARRSVYVSTGASGDTLFHAALYAAAGTLLLTLGAIIVLLFLGGLPALQHFGPYFFINTEWNPVTEEYGAGTMLYGTLVTAVIAVIVAVPASLGIAFFLTEVAGEKTKRPIAMGIQLLAAVPSIIYGMWGFFVIVPIMASTVQPLIIETLGAIPIIGVIFTGLPLGTGILTSGLILALMILPFITSMLVEILEAVPGVIKEAGYGVGSTTWEVFANVSVPYGRTAIVGAVMLGLGRALGETMAVTFVIGNATRISSSLLSPGASIASTIANEFPEAAPGSLKLYALLELGFALFVISFLVLALARYLVRSRLEA